jgi:hypothetical protein
MTNKIIRRVVQAVAVLTVGASVASASTISYYVDVFGGLSNATLCSGPCPTYTSSTLGTGSGQTINFNFPQFNQLGNVAEGTPTPGFIFSLTNVALALNWQATGNITIYNIGSNANVAFNSAKAETVMTLLADGTQVVGLGDASTGAGSVPFNNVLTAPPINMGDVSFSNLSGNGSNSQSSPNLPFYEGLGNNTFSAGVTIDSSAASGSSSDPNASHLAYQGGGQMGAIATITYTYTQIPVPEPMSSLLVGGALLGLGVLVRTRRARKE